MFPSGCAGIALVVLRSVVAVTVLVNATICWPTGFSLVVGAIAALVGLFLLLGFLTPYCATASCFLELALLVTAHAPNRLQLGLSALTAAATIGLGPGAYSVDARLFGRKLIKIPPGRNSPGGS
jgi:uncharacterized membrane protein YphA (DoxX/SURF4 family)